MRGGFLAAGGQGDGDYEEWNEWMYFHRWVGSEEKAASAKISRSKIEVRFTGWMNGSNHVA
ncbi:MAG: hypothetical protein BGO12_21415 [Verrucomicrobia bacterium 61-8]|nr:MAG: hypothetical protein BGO12_21415 [Verrucomicrobia bacterium 61-8]